MRVGVQKRSAKEPQGSSRIREAGPSDAPFGIAPPADLVALQRLISRADGSRQRAGAPRSGSDGQAGDPVQREAGASQATTAAPAPAATTSAEPVPPPLGPVADSSLILRVRAEGQLRPSPGNGVDLDPILFERTATLYDYADRPIGQQLPRGKWQFKDGSVARTTDGREPTGASAPVRVAGPPRPASILDDLDDIIGPTKVGESAVAGATSVDIVEYSPSGPPGPGATFRAVYEFRGDARASLVRLLRDRQTRAENVPNKLPANRAVTASTIAGLSAVELVLTPNAKGKNEVSGNTEGSQDAGHDVHHNDETSGLQKVVPVGTVYYPLDEALFTNMLAKLRALTPTDAGFGALEEITEARRPNNKSNPEPTTGRELGNFVTATAGRGYAAKYPKLGVFLRAYYRKYVVPSIPSPDARFFPPKTTTSGTPSISLDLLDNIITGFSSKQLDSSFPVGALGLIWVEGKEGRVQAFYIGDKKGAGQDGEFEAPYNLIAKADGKQGFTDGNAVPDSSYSLGQERAHVLVFPQTTKEAEFFADPVGQNTPHKLVRKDDAKDPFELLQRYLRAQSAARA